MTKSNKVWCMDGRDNAKCFCISNSYFQRGWIFWVTVEHSKHICEITVLYQQGEVSI